MDNLPRSSPIEQAIEYAVELHYGQQRRKSMHKCMRKHKHMRQCKHKRNYASANAKQVKVLLKQWAGAA